MIEDCLQEQQETCYKIEQNKKKIKIQSSVFEGNYKNYSLICVSDVTNLQNFEK